MLFSDPVSAPAETLVASLRDYPEWHRGRERYGVWIVPVVQPALLAYIDEVRRQLQDLLHPCPERQPHLTLFVCGFDQPVRTYDDDFVAMQLQQQVARLQAGAGSACALPLARPDSFASAAFIPVGDPEGRLAAWRATLRAAGREVRQAAYVPHITLGLYRRCVAASEIRARLGALQAPDPWLAVEQLHYATYLARSQFGALHAHHRVMLDAQIRSSAVAGPCTAR